MARVIAPIIFFSLIFSPIGLLSAAASSPPLPPSLIAVDGAVVDPAGWRLPVGSFVEAKMPMTLVYPRPDNETPDWARHRKAYPGLEYRIPISVQGGAYPFRYEILEGPPWLSIGSTVWEEGYGVLKGVPPMNEDGAGAQTVRIRVSGQEHERDSGDTVGPTFVVAAFELRVTSSSADFVFVDAAAEESGDGSFTNPLKRFADLHGDAFPGTGAMANRGTDTFAGRAVYFRAGSYQTADVPTPWLPWGSRERPYAFLGYPGEHAEIIFENAKLGNDSGGNLGADFFVGGLTLRKSQDISILPVTGFGSSWVIGDGWTTGNSSRMFWLTGSPARTTLFELLVAEQGPWIHSGTNHGGNSGMLYASSMGATSFRDYFTAWDIQAQDMRETIIGSMYSTRFGVIERVRVIPDSGLASGTTEAPALVFLKQNGVNWSLRRNEWTGFSRSHNANGALYVSMGPRSGNTTIPPTAEVCYNILHSVGNQRGYILNYSQSGTTGSEYPDGTTIWVYRNTLIGGFYRQTKKLTAIFESNVSMLRDSDYESATTGSSPPTEDSMMTIIYGDDELVGNFDSWQNYLDDQYKLKGRHREEWLGTVGHEFAAPQR